jgi:hypothetical protein
VQQRKQHNFYTGHGIQQTPISIGQLCVLYVIVSSSTQKPIHKLTKEDIGAYSERLGVKRYEEYYQTTLKAEVKKQYQVQGLQDMLLSPRLRKYPDGYATYSVCYTGMQPQMASKKTPPKFAIANGFVIGSFPQEIKYFNKEGQRVTRKVEDDELTDTLKAMVAPLRPYGYVFAYLGSAQKSLRGNY